MHALSCPRPRNQRLPACAAALLALLAAPLQAAPDAATPAARAPAASAREATAAGQCTRVEVAQPMQVSVGKSTVIRPAGAISRILLGHPDGSRAGAPREASPEAERGNGAGAPSAVADRDRLRPGVADVDVVLLGPTELFLLGKTLGTTHVVLLEQSGRCIAVEVVVSLDTTGLQALLEKMLPQEKEVRVGAAYDSIVLSGTVSDSATLSTVLELANAYVRSAGASGISVQGMASGAVGGINPRIINLLSTGAPQQVMLEVKVAEVSKAMLDQFGIDFSRAYASADGSTIRFLAGLLGGGALSTGQISGAGPLGAPLSSVGTVVGGSIPSSIASAGNVTQTLSTINGQVVPVYTTSYGTVPGRGVTNFGVNAQKTDGVVKVLAEPTVMAISGQKGSFLAGGKIFIPVAVDNGTSGRTVTLEEKEFGVSVNFLPTVLSGGRINLEVASEVSELNAQGIAVSALGLGGSTILPTFTSRRAKTTVQLADGQSFAIGGLIKNNATTNVRAFPVLGEIPILGALFRSTEFQTDRSELVFVITPRLVKPLTPGYALPTDHYAPPSRTQLHLFGRAEGRAAPAEAPPAELPQAPAAGFQVK
jgi:pilus assembly protein CpaC